jgi:hypothetical protein
MVERAYEELKHKTVAQLREVSPPASNTTRLKGTRNSTSLKVKLHRASV